MKSSRLEEDIEENIEENIIKDVRNLLRLKTMKIETSDAAIKGIRSLFRIKKKIKQLNTEKLRN